MSRRTQAISIVAALAALATPLVAGQAAGGNELVDKPPAMPSEVVVSIDGDSPSNLTVTFEQTYEDEKAIEMRRSLDAYFGAGTGDLSDEEVAALEDAIEADLPGAEVDWLALDREVYTIRDVDVSFRGAEGRVDMPRPLTMVHTLMLEAPAVTDERATLQFYSLWNGTLAFDAPPGWYVAAVDDLEGAGGDAEMVRGDFQQGRAAQLLLVQGEPPRDAPDGMDGDADGAFEENGIQEATAGGAEVAALVVVVTALVVGALLAWRATRR